jgi:hypothetical protein
MMRNFQEVVVRHFWILGVLSCVIIYGCSNQKHHEKFSSLRQKGTYVDDHKYVVEFRGGGVTSYQKAKQYAYMRAAQATLSQGYRYFKVVKTENISQSKNIKSIAKDDVENFALFSTIKQGDKVKERSPGIRLHFECYKNDPKIFSSIDAEEYLRNKDKN